MVTIEDAQESLLHASGMNDAAAIREAARRGADLNAPGRFGDVPLRNACLADGLEAIEALLELGADPNRRFTHRSPVDKQEEVDVVALMYVMSAEAADLLVRSGADVNAANADGTTSLIAAVFNGFPSVVEHLVGAGADVDARQRRGRGRKAHTALEHARRKLAFWSALPEEQARPGGLEERRGAHSRVIEILERAGAR